MANKSASSKGKQIQHKERGTWLTIALIIIILHGILGAIFYYAVRTDPNIDRIWLVGLMILHWVLNVVAAIGIWSWKKWGLYLYIASTILAVTIGLLAIGMWSVFYFVLPLAILGYILRSKYEYFE